MRFHPLATATLAADTFARSLAFPTPTPIGAIALASVLFLQNPPFSVAEATPSVETADSSVAQILVCTKYSSCTSALKENHSFSHIAICRKVFLLSVVQQEGLPMTINLSTKTSLLVPWESTMCRQSWQLHRSVTYLSISDLN